VSEDGRQLVGAVLAGAVDLPEASGEVRALAGAMSGRRHAFTGFMRDARLLRYVLKVNIVPLMQVTPIHIVAWTSATAFCGFDGALRGAPGGSEAAHIRWFNFDGPDDLDNGLALCSLHHKLLDRGAIGLRDPGTVVVSDGFCAVGDVGRTVYALDGRELRPRPGNVLPAAGNVLWHTREVFKGDPLAA
jgi:hypothetical protein